MASKTRRDGRCFWLQQAIAPGEEDAPPLVGDARCDIAIVGGGMAGLWTALELKNLEGSLDVAILEADICGGGASGRASGMVLPQWVKFEALLRMCGAEGARLFCQATQDFVDGLPAFCREHEIAAQVRRDAWLWGATCPAQMGSWNSVAATLTKHGLSPLQALTRSQINDLLDAPGLLGGALLDGTATLQPAMWVRGLRRLALRRDIRIYENSALDRLEQGSPLRITTRTGSLTADRVCLCMNAWSLMFPELRPAVLVIASDDAITAPIPELLDRHRYRAKPLITDSQIFVTGFRTTVDDRLNAGVSGGRIGYAGLRSERFEGRSPRDAEIRACVGRVISGLGEVPFIDSWYGPIDRTRSGLPLYGALPGRAGVYYNYGYSGNGIATTPVGGKIMASLLLGRRDQWSSLGLVRPVEHWLPPEPLKLLGALAVRSAIQRKDRLAYSGRKPGLVAEMLAGLAPGGVVTTPKD